MSYLSDSPWREILLLLAGAGLACVGYFGKRWLEGASRTVRLDRRRKLLALHKELKSEGMTVTDLDSLEQELTTRRKVARQIEEQVAAEIAEAPRPGETQADMNVLAEADLDVSKAMLAKAVRELEIHASPDELEQLSKAQRAWQRYADTEAISRAAFYTGGSMYPMVYSYELEQITVARIADLRTRLEWLKEMSS